MGKWTAFVFAALAVGAVVVMLTLRPEQSGASSASTAVADAGHDGGERETPARSPIDAGALVHSAGDAGEPTPEDTASPSPESPFGGSDAGATLLNGTAPPSLAGDAPKSVVFGVILVQYKGAQAAPASARSRDAAIELARQLAADARTDFKAALAKGDRGSVENAGRMPRGMLEPAPEYVLFSLPKDGVSDPVDTPRGYWIMHRIE
jgi:PPIC-type PPIASE domain